MMRSAPTGERRQREVEENDDVKKDKNEYVDWVAGVSPGVKELRKGFERQAVRDDHIHHQAHKERKEEIWKERK